MSRKRVKLRISAGAHAARRARSAALRAKRAELAGELQRRRTSARAELQRRADGGRSNRSRRRRWWWLWVLLALLLWLFLRDCSCAVPLATPVEAVPADVGAAPAVGVTPAPSAPRPRSDRVVRRERPVFQAEALEPLPWLASFRLQVSARGPRLAECFVGAQRPGTLRWTALVEPSRGRVSDQTLEPTLLSDDLTRQQRACALDVLSEPTYRLDSEGERATPSRVGMVIEF